MNTELQEPLVWLHWWRKMWIRRWKNSESCRQDMFGWIGRGNYVRISYCFHIFFCVNRPLSLAVPSLQLCCCFLWERRGHTRWDVSTPTETSEFVKQSGSNHWTKQWSFSGGIVATYREILEQKTPPTLPVSMLFSLPCLHPMETWRQKRRLSHWKKTRAQRCQYVSQVSHVWSQHVR